MSHGLMGLRAFFTEVEEVGVWPEGLLDAYIAMIRKVDGDSTPLDQRLVCVLLVVYRILAFARMMHLEDWFRSRFPDSVYSAGSGRSSVEAWYTTALDIEELLCECCLVSSPALGQCGCCASSLDGKGLILRNVFSGSSSA